MGGLWDYIRLKQVEEFVEQVIGEYKGIGELHRQHGKVEGE